MPMIHRRALITGLLASVAAPALARLAPVPSIDDMIVESGPVYYTPYAVGWHTYWDGENICRREISWDDFYLVRWD